MKLHNLEPVYFELGGNCVLLPYKNTLRLFIKCNDILPPIISIFL